MGRRRYLVVVECMYRVDAMFVGRSIRANRPRLDLILTNQDEVESRLGTEVKFNMSGTHRNKKIISTQPDALRRALRFGGF